MSRARVPATAAYAALAAADSLLAAGPPAAHRWRRVTKPLLMPVLAAGLRRADRTDPAVRRTLAAQGFSWGGDVALLGSGRAAFLTGLGSFLGAHLAYVAAFRDRAPAPLLATRGSRTTLAAAGLLAPAMAAAARRREPALAGPVAAYALVLGTMAATAAALPDAEGRARVATGAALFLLSDGLLGVRTFVLARRSAALDAAVMATYTAGQWCLADGLARR